MTEPLTNRDLSSLSEQVRGRLEQGDSAVIEGPVASGASKEETGSDTRLSLSTETQMQQQQQ